MHENMKYKMREREREFADADVTHLDNHDGREFVNVTKETPIIAH